MVLQILHGPEKQRMVFYLRQSTDNADEKGIGEFFGKVFPSSSLPVFFAVSEYRQIKSQWYDAYPFSFRYPKTVSDIIFLKGAYHHYPIREFGHESLNHNKDKYFGGIEIAVKCVTMECMNYANSFARGRNHVHGDSCKTT